MGEVLAGLETKESTHLSPSPATHEASMAPFQGSGPCPCRTRCSTLRVRLFSSHWTISPTEYKQGQGWVHPDLSLSHFNDWTGLSEGCAYYCRRWASLIPLLIERPSKCILLFATLWGHQKWLRNRRFPPPGLWAWICLRRLVNLHWELVWGQSTHMCYLMPESIWWKKFKVSFTFFLPDDTNISPTPQVRPAVECRDDLVSALPWQEKKKKTKEFIYTLTFQPWRNWVLFHSSKTALSFFNKVLNKLYGLAIASTNQAFNPNKVCRGGTLLKLQGWNSSIWTPQLL